MFKIKNYIISRLSRGGKSNKDFSRIYHRIFTIDSRNIYLLNYHQRSSKRIKDIFDNIPNTTNKKCYNVYRKIRI